MKTFGQSSGFNQYICPLSGSKGFTLVELLTTLVVSMLVLAALYSAYLTQQRSQTAQDQVVEMQQQARAGLNMMLSEIRMAGFDPQSTTNPRIITATRDLFRFSLDLNENGTVPPAAGNPNEDITYGFSAANDANNDSIADAGVAPLGRQVNNAGGFQPIAENIQAIEFLYLIGDSMQPKLSPTAAELDSIRAVTISILARVGNVDPNFVNTASYTAASGTTWDLNGAAAGTAPNDNFRRRLYITTVHMRNVGL